MRINKYLSEAGIVSRRGADKWIEDGRIMINGPKILPKIGGDREIIQSEGFNGAAFGIRHRDRKRHPLRCRSGSGGGSGKL